MHVCADCMLTAHRPQTDGRKKRARCNLVLHAALCTEPEQLQTDGNKNNKSMHCCHCLNAAFYADPETATDRWERGESMHFLFPDATFSSMLPSVQNLKT